jgi:peptidoglycan/LPS O-acetylase OafA/YrhL
LAILCEEDKTVISDRKRTTSIELLRFIAAIGVMLFHFGAVYLGENGVFAPYAYVFVEFFLMLAGFFMIRYLETHDDPLMPVPYLWRKIKSFYAIFIIAFGCQFILFVIANQVSGVSGYFGSLFHFKWEALLLQCSGSIQDPAFNKDYLLGQDWYLSAMMLALLFIYPIARNYRRFYRQFLAPAVAVLFYGVMIQYYGTLNVGSEYLGVVTLAIVRGMAGVCLGSLCYYALEWVKKKEFTDTQRQLLSAVEVVCWVFIVLLLGPSRFTGDGDVPFFLLIFGFVIVMGFDGRTWLSSWLNSHGNRVLTWAGALSLYIYLSHWTVMTAMNLISPGLLSTVATAVYIVVTLAVSILGMWLNSRRKSSVPVILIFAVLLGVAFLVVSW